MISNFGKYNPPPFLKIRYHLWVAPFKKAVELQVQLNWKNLLQIHNTHPTPHTMAKQFHTGLETLIWWTLRLESVLPFIGSSLIAMGRWNECTSSFGGLCWAFSVIFGKNQFSLSSLEFKIYYQVELLT